jgi:outer membrane murein-binding lipoprotein Lpp
MNKLLVALFAIAVASIPLSAMADDSDVKPLSKMQTDEAKAAKAAAKAKWDKMTPDEQAAAKKAARAKKQADQTAIDRIAQESGNMKYDTQQGKMDAAKSKEQPKPTKAQREQDLNATEKKAGPGQ